MTTVEQLAKIEEAIILARKMLADKEDARNQVLVQLIRLEVQRDMIHLYEHIPNKA